MSDKVLERKVEILLNKGFSENEILRKLLREERARLLMETKAQVIRDYLSQEKDVPKYKAYLQYLKDTDKEDSKVAPQYFSQYKKKYSGSIGTKPVAKKPGGTDLEKRRNTLSQLTTNWPRSPEDIKANINSVLKSQGLRKDEDIYIVKSSEGPHHFAMVNVETGDRGPRTDHGGPDGEGWMSPEEIRKNAAPYYKKWAPRLEKLVSAFKSKGFTVRNADIDYGEKGHIAITVILEVSVK